MESKGNRRISRLNVQRIEQTLEAINAYSDSGSGINRLAYTETERRAVASIQAICEAEGMSVRIDAAGNLIARREGTNTGLPVIAFGSHIDSVYAAGKYDGALGVAVAIEVIRSLNEKGIETEHPLEFIVFACEESARFGFSTLGSKAIAGQLEQAELIDLKDKNGVSLQEVFAEHGLALENIKQAERKRRDFKAFFELHIEQGPVLEKEDRQIGIVSGIAGSTRFKVTVKGVASHSGTTPMDYRKDALLGAAEVALMLEEAAKAEHVHGTVATVGMFEVRPGAMNIVPGAVEMYIDIRSISEASRNTVVEKLEQKIKEIRENRQLLIHSKKVSEQPSVKLDEQMIDEIIKTCKGKGCSYQLMPSGAGHDAMNMAALCPTGLIFIPSRNGLSHNPDEYSSMEQIALGADVLQSEILKWAKISNQAAR